MQRTYTLLTTTYYLLPTPYLQLTYTLVPALLLLLRVALLAYAADWAIGRRLMRDAELCLVLVAVWPDYTATPCRTPHTAHRIAL